MRSFKSVPNLAMTADVHLKLDGITDVSTSTSKTCVRSPEERRARRLDAYSRSSMMSISTSSSMYMDNISNTDTVENMDVFDRSLSSDNDNIVTADITVNAAESAHVDIATDVRCDP